MIYFIQFIGLLLVGSFVYMLIKGIYKSYIFPIVDITKLSQKQFAVLPKALIVVEDKQTNALISKLIFSLVLIVLGYAWEFEIFIVFAVLVLVDTLIRFTQVKETLKTTLYHNKAFLGDKLVGYIKLEKPIKKDFIVSIRNIHCEKQRVVSSSSSDIHRYYNTIYFSQMLGDSKIDNKATYVVFEFDIPKDAIPSGKVETTYGNTISEEYYWEIELRENKKFMPLQREYRIVILNKENDEQN
jgi:hypothetical protein